MRPHIALGHALGYYSDMPTIRETLLAEIDAYLAETGVSASDFGVTCMGDPSFVGRLRAGRDVKASTIDKVRRWMKSHPLGRGNRPSDSRVAA